jgi:restriction endonuclease S subunit
MGVIKHIKNKNMENDKNVIEEVTVIREECSGDDKNDEKCCFTVKKNFFKKDKSEKCEIGPIYGLGFIGSLFYFIGSASGFGSLVFGIVKSIF